MDNTDSTYTEILQKWSFWEQRIAVVDDCNATGLFTTF